MTDRRYAEAFPEETTVIYEQREDGYRVYGTSAGFGASSSDGGTTPPAGGATGGELRPPEGSGYGPIDSDEPWTENYDEPITDEQDRQIGVRHNTRTTDPQAGTVDWSIVDEVFGRVVSETYGSENADGSRSYTDRTTYADGSTQLVTRTTGADGHGQEQVTDTDASGAVTSDTTTPF
ncbi:hypothetical protein DMP17_34880 [Pseudonocardia sp. TMWB2A]|uniref:hypothetical protein n=1 Tax=Pseudonocardia sp. TMWB2A TaxID=687430 RepID=UPI00307DE27A